MAADFFRMLSSHGQRPDPASKASLHHTRVRSAVMTPSRKQRQEQQATQSTFQQLSKWACSKENIYFVFFLHLYKTTGKQQSQQERVNRLKNIDCSAQTLRKRPPPRAPCSQPKSSFLHTSLYTQTGPQNLSATNRTCLLVFIYYAIYPSTSMMLFDQKPTSLVQCYFL